MLDSWVKPKTLKPQRSVVLLELEEVRCQEEIQTDEPILMSKNSDNIITNCKAQKQIHGEKADNFKTTCLPRRIRPDYRMYI